MDTGQVIIVIIVGTLAIAAFAKSMSDANTVKGLVSIMVLFLCTLLFAALTVVMTISHNNLLNRSVPKCPEYEKIENVYRIKPQK